MNYLWVGLLFNQWLKRNNGYYLILHCLSKSMTPPLLGVLVKFCQPQKKNNVLLLIRLRRLCGCSYYTRMNIDKDDQTFDQKLSTSNPSCKIVMVGLG